MEEERFPNSFYKAALFWYHDQTKTAQKNQKTKNNYWPLTSLKYMQKSSTKYWQVKFSNI